MKERSSKTSESPKQSLPRRDFVKTTAAAGAGVMFIPAASVFGTPANSSLGLGIIGCGGRGTYDGGEFLNHTDVRVTALMDLFDDRLLAAKDRLDKAAEQKGYARIQAENVFKGPKAYEKLVQSKDVDLVLITSPPYFHPEHFEAAVAAGKHVYLEKPVATDVAGCMRVIKTGRQANGKLSVHVGFQKRYDEGYKAALAKIHAGEIGEIILGQTFYYTNDLGRKEKAGLSEVENRLRNWVFDRALSGDILVEQNIHILDAVNWALRAHPVKASGQCGRAERKEVAAIPPEFLCSDYFIMTFTYPGDVKISFNSNQFKNKGYRQTGERLFGTLGVSETLQGGPNRMWLNKDDGVKILDTPVNPQTSVGLKMKALVESIKSGKFENQAGQGAESTLTTILGRMAAYSGKEVTWEALLKSGEKWNPKLNLDALASGTISMK